MSQNVLEVPMGRKQIEAIIPHRGKWLLLDTVTEIGDGRIVAEKTFSEKECAGHFGIVPGHLICEALAQAGAVLVLSQYFKKIKKNEGVLLLRTSGKFFSLVRPGEKLILKTILERLVSTMGAAFLNGKAFLETSPNAKPVADWEGTGKIKNESF